VLQESMAALLPPAAAAAPEGLTPVRVTASAAVVADMEAVVVPDVWAPASIMASAQFELYGRAQQDSSLVRAWHLHSNKYKITLRI